MSRMNNDIKKVLYSEEELKALVADLGAKISEDYKDKNLLMVSVLKGSVVFMSDLMSQMKQLTGISENVTFMAAVDASSYDF